MKVVFGDFKARIRGLQTVEDESLPNSGLCLIMDPEPLLNLQINYSQPGPS